MGARHHGWPATITIEVAPYGLTAEQLRWQVSALLLAADLIHRVHDDQDPDRLAEVDVGRAIAYGLELGANSSAPLLAQRWEEGWERPLAEWRERLGLSAVIWRNPIAAGAGGRD